MAFDTALRVFLGCYFLFVAVHYSAWLIGLRQRYGRSRVRKDVLGSSNSLHQITFSAFRSLILTVCLVRVVYPGLDEWLGAAPGLNGLPVLNGTGAVLMLAAFGWIDYCKSYMDHNWASGTDADHLSGSKLLTSGPFSITRNPIFIGILVGQAGFMLAFPSAFTVICFGVGVATILRQSAIEELALRRRFGQRYLIYAEEVPRWFHLPSRSIVNLLTRSNRSD